MKSAKDSDVPANPLARSAWSVIGTLSLMSGSCEIPRLHNSFGPIRNVTQRHTQRLVRWLISEDWIFKQQNHVPFSEGSNVRLAIALWPIRRDQKLGYGRLAIAFSSGHVNCPVPQSPEALNMVYAENSHHGERQTRTRTGKRLSKTFSSWEKPGRRKVTVSKTKTCF